MKPYQTSHISQGLPPPRTTPNHRETTPTAHIYIPSCLDVLLRLRFPGKLLEKFSFPRLIAGHSRSYYVCELWAKWGKNISERGVGKISEGGGLAERESVWVSGVRVNLRLGVCVWHSSLGLWFLAFTGEKLSEIRGYNQCPNRFQWDHQWGKRINLAIINHLRWLSWIIDKVCKAFDSSFQWERSLGISKFVKTFNWVNIIKDDSLNLFSTASSIPNFQDLTA